MDFDLKTKMDDVLKQKLDHVFSIKMQPALYLSKRFDSIVSSIDLDAEQIMRKLGQHSEEASKVNNARCEFIRILKATEKNLQTRVLANEPLTRQPGEAFEALEKRVKEFRETSISQGDDGINDLEDTYGQLVVEIAEMDNAEDADIFGNQTMFYWSSDGQRELGSLFHLSTVTLTLGQLDCMR